MDRLITITRLTLHEARRRKIFLAILVCGLAFVALFSIGLLFVSREMSQSGRLPLVQRRLMSNFFILAGLYGVNFLTIVSAVLLPVDTLSGEIASGVMQTLAAKPIRRSEILLGKWLGFAIVMTSYLALVAGGILIAGRVIAGFVPPHLAIGLPLMLLEGLVLLTLSVAGGASMSTIANGITVFGLYGLAFLGSWTEQIGAMAGNDTARAIGTAASLVMPSEALWQLAAWHMQPPLMRELQLTPFSPASVPSGAMVAWAAGYVVVMLLVGLRRFHRRGL